MSDQVNVGDYSLEISGDEVVVRDESGTIVETVELTDLQGELKLPDGQQVDLAAVFANQGIETFQTAAGPANDNLGYIDGGPSVFHAFHNADTEFGGFNAEGTLGDTTLNFDALNTNDAPTYDPNLTQEAPVLVTWSSHDPWHIAENQDGGSLGKVIGGNPSDFTFAVSDPRFEVVDGVLRVRDGVSFNHENEPGVDLEITATSRTGDVRTLSTHIDIDDVNEAQTGLSIDGTRIDENVAGAVVGTLTVADPDGDDSQSFFVSDSRFEIVDGQLKLKDGISLDHESDPTLDVTVTVTDNGGNQIQRTFTIEVGDVNEEQTALTLDGNTVLENAAGAVIGTLTVADPDAGDSQAFSVSDNRFEVVDGQLKLKDGVSLDHEGEPTVSVTVTATDSAGHQLQQSFDISVGDVNEAPTGIDLSNSALVENVAGAVIGSLTAIDPDVGDTHSFEVSDSRFEVVNGQLKLKDGVLLDFESEPNLNVVVTATDRAGHQVQETFTLSVGDANEAQSALSLSGSNVTENIAGAVIGALTVADADSGDTQSFAVSDNRFEVVNGQLKLKDGVSLDHEGEPTVNVQVTAIDAGGNQIAKTFTITVGDVNEAQTSLTLSNNNVAENAKGAVIGTVLVADPDVGDKQTLSVSDNRFQIVNGQLKLKSGVSIDYESEPIVDVKVTATDKSGHQITQTFTINVGDVNEAQTGMSLSANKVAENSAGAVIGALSVADPDAGDIQSFKVSDSRFEVVNGQLKLKDGVSLNYESVASVNVKVTATDSANHQISKTFAIGVQDVNEAQTAMTLSAAKVSENAAGAVIGALKVTDPDKGDSQSFSVSDNRFEVVNGQLKLKDGVSLDYEQASKVSVNVTATDTANHQITKTFSISVTNVNEAQTAMTLSANSLKENAAGATIGKLTVTDPDAGDKQSFTVSDARFEVVNNQLRLKPGVSLDFEQASSVNVDVTATDKGGNQITKTFTINVTDVNEAQTALTLDNMQVSENTPGGIIGKLSVADQDIGDTQTFKVSDNRFEVVGGQLKLKSGVSFDHETTGSVDVTVTATDSAKHSISQTFSVAIGDVNEAQTGMSLASSQVMENTAGAVIGAVSVTDPDAGDVQSFQVSDNRFEVMGGQLKLKDGVSLDHEAAGSVDVTVTATDMGGNQIAKTFTIAVGDVNEAQAGMSLAGSQVAENAAGAVVGALTVADPDAGDSQSFQVSDNRFEVVNNQLKLKSGISLDHEGEPTVNVTVTATDSAGHQIQQTFAIGVTDVNEASTGIQLSNASVDENASGATVGKLTTVDPDAADTFSYQVSDSRFQVVNGQLQLKSGVSLDHEAEPTVNLKVTSTDSAGHAIQQSFTVNVANVNEAPVVAAKDGSLENHIVNTSTAYNPVANSTVGAYLYSNDSAGIAKPASNLLNGVDPSNMTLSAATPVTVTFQKEAAGNHNMIGTYQYDSNGNVIAGSVKFVWLDASANNEGVLGSSMVKDFLGYSQSNSISLGTMAAGTHVGFFAISNGANDSGNKTLLTNAAAGTNNQTAAMAAIASQLSIKLDANGNGHVYVGNSQMNGDVFFTHNKTLNTDFNGSSDIDHMASGVSANLAHQIVVGVEDLAGGGDKDFNDVVFSVDLGTYNVNKMTQSSLQPTVDFSDVDSNTLSQAVIHTSGFQAGDLLNVPPSSAFNVSVNQSGADYTITIVGKTGSETVDQYETFANSIYFSTTSKTEGDRHIDYSVTDNGGLSSTVSTADIGVKNSYEISSSQLGGQSSLGAGDDLLHINTSSVGPLDLGDGNDTVHLGQQGMSFGHSLAANLHNVEAIDATGYGANNVALSINDVLDITDADNHLTVVGEKGDTVTLSGDGSGNHWSIVSSDANFTTYAWSDPAHQAVVEISNQLNTQVS